MNIKSKEYKMGRCSRDQYRATVWRFDKELQVAKHRCTWGVTLQLEEMNINDPKAMWEQLKHMGPRSKKEVKCKAPDKKGNITVVQVRVKEYWFKEYEELFTSSPQERFDEGFHVKQLKRLRELEMQGRVGSGRGESSTGQERREIDPGLMYKQMALKMVLKAPRARALNKVAGQMLKGGRQTQEGDRPKCECTKEWS